MVVAHEMAHMWFGDLVTMRWWDDLWLNESFAELLGFLTVDRATRFEGTWVDFSASRKAWGYRADQLPSTHPVQGDVPDNRSALLNFDGISYAKGASVLRQLMATRGRGRLLHRRAGLRRAARLRQHDASPTCSPSSSAPAAATCSDWSRAWLQTSGVSTLRTVVDERRRLRCGRRPTSCGRTGSASGLYDRAGDALVLRERLDVEVDRRAGAALDGRPAGPTCCCPTTAT